MIPCTVTAATKWGAISRLKWIFPPRYPRFRQSHPHPRRVSLSTQNIDSDDGATESNIVERLPWQYLRASDPSNYDRTTYQRKNVAYNIKNGKPILVGQKKTDPRRKAFLQNVSVGKNGYQVQWKDGKISNHPIGSLHDEYNRWNRSTTESRVLWSGLTAETVRESLSLPFSYLMTNVGQKAALRTLYEYGILLVTNTPIPTEEFPNENGAGIAALGASLGGGSIKRIATNSVLVNYYHEGGMDVSLPHATDGPLRTLYGTVWSTVSEGQTVGSSVADSAYGQDALPLHTDMSYFRDPPGLQIFTMVQPAIRGGESIFGDGFAVAQRLRESNLPAFGILSQTIRRYLCKDDAAGWHLEASGPVIQLCPRGHEIVGIRHNDLDRLPDLPPRPFEDEEQDDADEFYQALEEAHQAWDSLLAEDEFRLVVKLQPGETMVVANQRCMHGRYSFTSDSSHPRSVMGCYIGQDELYSRMRMEGLYLY